MNPSSQISNLDFKKVLTPENIRVLRIIFLALAAGVFTFGLVILIIYFQQTHSDYNEVMTPTLNLLSVMNLIFALTSIVLGKFMYDRQFQTATIEIQKSSGVSNSKVVANNLSTAEKCLATIRTASIIRLAMLEGSALLGLVVTLLAVQSGAGNQAPMYFLNALTTLPLFITIVIIFPTADRLEQIFQEKIFKR